MADVVLSVLLLAAAAAALLLAQRALRHWWVQRAGRPYELRVDHRGTVLWSAAAVVAAAVAIALAVPLLSGPDPAPGPRVVVAAAPVTPPPAPPRTPAPAPPAPIELRTVGHPSGGTLQELTGGVRVWLPPWYDSRNAAHLAYPVVVADVPAASADEVYEGFARQAKRGLADPFLVVMPRDCGQDTAAVLADVARKYRVLSTAGGRGVLGAGADASCAVHEAFAHPDRYGAAAGLSGSYPAPLPTPGAVRPALLLAYVAGAPGARTANRDLRDALHSRGDQVRVIDVSGRRGELYAQAAAYLTEKLDGPTRIAAGTSPGRAAR
ncbi:MAG TPA: hypothetical protein VGL02_04790 [Streptomyces sp.]